MTSQHTNKPRVFIDGEAGTTGLQILNRLQNLDTVELQSIDPAKRKDPDVRRSIMADVDLTVLCLPDAAAREAVQLAQELGNDAPRIIDASTAHRIADNWVYGFAELASGQRDLIRDARHVSNPGCYSTGAIALIRPLVDAGLLAADHPLCINAVSGYSGGGRQMIETYEGDPSGNDMGFKFYGLGLDHKHLPELQKYSRLTRQPIFVPSVGNFRQGMLVAVPLHLDMLPTSPSPEDLAAALRNHYESSDVVSFIPTTRTDLVARAANALAAESLNDSDKLELRLYCNEEKSQVLLVARLDNLGKGAAGAAVQNIKLMLGLD